RANWWKPCERKQHLFDESVKSYDLPTTSLQREREKCIVWNCGPGPHRRILLGKGHRRIRPPRFPAMEHAMQPIPRCPDCDEFRGSDLGAGQRLTRRDFVRVTGSAAATVMAGSLGRPVRADQQAAKPQS